MMDGSRPCTMWHHLLGNSAKLTRHRSSFDPVQLNLLHIARQTLLHEEMVQFSILIDFLSFSFCACEHAFLRFVQVGLCTYFSESNLSVQR